MFRQKKQFPVRTVAGIGNDFPGISAISDKLFCFFSTFIREKMTGQSKNAGKKYRTAIGNFVIPAKGRSFAVIHENERQPKQYGISFPFSDRLTGHQNFVMNMMIQ